MDPNVWGPHGWFFIQSCIVNIPDEADMSKYVDFLFSLQYVLPCGECRNNYSIWLRNNPIPMQKPEMIQWITDLQNSIRKKNGSSTRSTEDVIKFYNEKSPLLPILAIITISIFLFIE